MMHTRFLGGAGCILLGHAPMMVGRGPAGALGLWREDGLRGAPCASERGWWVDKCKGNSDRSESGW